MITVSDGERLARAAISAIAEPGNKELGRALRQLGAQQTLDQIESGQLRAKSTVRWQARLSGSNPGRDLEKCRKLGGRLVCPGDPEWPSQLHDLGDEEPYALWIRGAGDLRYLSLRSVALVGTRSATAYGSHVAIDLANRLGERGWTVVSGGAYGIDGAAHRGALLGGGVTIAILACGVGVSYPRGHDGLYAEIIGEGLLISELPPGAAPLRHRFLTRNRVIAALAKGTVVVEAPLRSGAMNTARHAGELGRALMAVPGPLTSPMSAGSHYLMRECGAICITGADDVLEDLGAIGEPMIFVPREPILPRDALDETTRRVLDVVPGRQGAGPATIATQAGVDIDTALRCLGSLAAGGFVRRCERGWRLINVAGRSPRERAPPERVEG